MVKYIYIIYNQILESVIFQVGQFSARKVGGLDAEGKSDITLVSV